MMKNLRWVLLAMAFAGGTASCAESLPELGDWLERTGGRLIRLAERKMSDGRTVYAPQGGNWYQATWLRDYVMMLEGELVPKERQDAIAELFLSAVSPEGEGFDCIAFDGTVMRRPGYDKYGDKPVMDGFTYVTTLVYETWRQTGNGKWLRPDVLDKLARMLDAMPHAEGLPWIDPKPERARCPWGFTDSVCKSGKLFFMTLLEIRARRELSDLLDEAHRPDEAAAQRVRAARLADEANRVFWDGDVGLYRATTARCRQHDIWGSAYAVWLGVAPDARADRIAGYFKAHYDGIVQNGQVRHLPAGVYWDKTCFDKTDFYQNGQFWGTPVGWFCWTIERIDPKLADKTFAALVEDYRRRGVNERVFGKETSCPDYLASVALPLQGIRRLIAKRTRGEPTVRQVFRPERFTRGDTSLRAIQEADRAAWICPPGANEGFFRFRRAFASDGSPLRFDVTADERFVLFLDGKPVSTGPHRGQVSHWYYQTYEVTGLSRGRHLLDAVVWRLGGSAPIAQLSWNIGFLLKAEGAYDSVLTTGRAAWEVAPVPGTRPDGAAHPNAFGAGAKFVVEGASVFDWIPDPQAWKPAAVRRGPIREDTAYGVMPDGWKLFPTERKDQISVVRTPGRIVNADRDPKKPFTVPAKSEVDYLWNLDDYVCGYPQLLVSGGKGATVEWSWTESLRGPDGKKGDRNAWRGKTVTECVTDRFLPDGRPTASFSTPWWRCGKWCRIHIRTADEPLTVERLAIREERYPLSFDAEFECSDPSLTAIQRLCRRTLENCCHEMLMDCPFYEQQMYPGDTRIQLQVINAQSLDGRMARFALSVYDYNRRSDGFADMNYPTRMTQESATFTLSWLLMFRDHAMWRNEATFLRAHMPGVRNALMNFELYEDRDGLVRDLPGWCFVDWVDGWTRGVPPGAAAGKGTSAVVNLLYLLAQRAVADVEEALGERQLAARGRERAARLSRSIVARFWDQGRGLMADTFARDSFSEHAQALAILADVLDPADRKRVSDALAGAPGLRPASASFCHYLFGAFARCGRPDLILKRLDVWRNYLAHGANTAFETQDVESRSDCHAWCACPLYCFQTVFAGVEPDAPFFRSVRIAPQPGSLSRIRAKTPSPSGLIETDFDFAEGRVSGRIVLPGDLTGTFVWRGTVRKLKSGVNEL